MSRTWITLGAAVVLATSLAAVGTQSSAAAPTTSTAISTSSPCIGAAAPAQWDHVALLIFENRSYSQIVGNTTDAPYLNSLIRACASGKGMHQVSGVSLPNYIALTSGYTGCDKADASGVCTHLKPVTSNRSPSTWPQAQASLFELLGDQAQELEELEPSNCYLQGSGDFIINHTPFQFFTRARTLCQKYAVRFVPSPAAPNPLAKKFNLLTPARRGIMHGGYTSTLNQRTKAGDDWAAKVIPQLLASPEYQAGRTAIIITWDEGSGASAVVPFIVISPSTRAGSVSSVTYNHYSTLKGIEQMLGVTRLLGHAGDSSVASIASDPAFGL